MCNGKCKCGQLKEREVSKKTYLLHVLTISIYSYKDSLPVNASYWGSVGGWSLLQSEPTITYIPSYIIFILPHLLIIILLIVVFRELKCVCSTSADKYVCVQRDLKPWSLCRTRVFLFPPRNAPFSFRSYI